MYSHRFSRLIYRRRLGYARELVVLVKAKIPVCTSNVISGPRVELPQRIVVLFTRRSSCWRFSAPGMLQPAGFNVTTQLLVHESLRSRAVRNYYNCWTQGCSWEMQCSAIFGPHEPLKRIVVLLTRVELLEVLCPRDASTSPRSVPARLPLHSCGSSRK